MSGAGFDMCVFRDGRQPVAGHALLGGLMAELRDLEGTADPEARRQRTIAALVHAGELECVLEDAGARDAPLLVACTDALAHRLLAGRPWAGGLRGRSPEGSPEDSLDPGGLPALLLARLAQVRPPAVARVSRPEGFAYYALHPLDFARAVEGLSLDARPVFVVGLRSIGTTLSAVVAAAARRQRPAERITVRPTGHPYDRQLALSAEERRWVARGVRAGASFLVVDEGPGLSGSSLLSVGEAVHEAGVPLARITLLCSRQPDPHALLARDAARRFARFRVRASRGPCQGTGQAAGTLPGGVAEMLDAGRWRQVVYADESRWPASWTAMERCKYRSREGRLVKFEGLGRYGGEVEARGLALAEAGFAPAPRREGDGFLSYAWIPGRPLDRDALAPDRASPGDPGGRAHGAALLDRLADYCAFRAGAFPARAGAASGPAWPAGGTAALVHMMRTNHLAELGCALDPEPDLPAPRPVIVDGRMQPHEWILSAGGTILKVDGASHGDDHFFPGPTDIAWDLAGVLVEWALDEEARERFLQRYRARSGDDPDARLPGYVLAYLLFRLAHTKMAAGAMRGAAEEPRLRRDYRRYRALLDRALAGARGRGVAPHRLR